MEQRKNLERAHFSKPESFQLESVKRNKSGLERFIARLILRTMDRQLGLIDGEFIRGKYVFDACCGDGRNTFMFSDSGAAAVIGGDLTRAALFRHRDEAQIPVLDRTAAVNLESIQLMDCESLPFADQSLDTVSVLMGLHHMDAQSFLAESYRVLKAHGALIVVDPNGGHILRRLGTAMGRRSGISPEHESFLAMPDVARLLRSNGFRIVAHGSFNLFSEIWFQITEMFRRRADVSFYLKIGLAVLNPLDELLRVTLFRFFPGLGWRQFAVAKKNHS